MAVGGAFSLEDTTGSITQLATPLQTGAGASFKTDATGQTITLDDPANALKGTVALNTTGSGADATLINTVDTTLGTSTVGGNLTLSITGALSLAGVVSGTVIDISASGGVSEAGGGIIGGGTLQSSSGVTGNVTLNNANSVAAIGSLAVTGGGFSLTNGSGQSVSVTGPLTATTDLSISNSGAGAIAVSGSIGATAGTIALSSGSGGIALNTGHVLSAITADLSATGGGVTQVATGTISATTLQSSGGVTGDVSLLGSGNAVSTLKGFAVSSGNFALANTSVLTVSGVVSTTMASSQIYLRAPSIIIAATGAVNTPSGTGTTSFQSDLFSMLGAGAVTGNIVELAPKTSSHTVTLGLAGGLSILDDSNITANLLRIGAVTVPGSGLTTTAGTISVGDVFGSAGRALELDSNGGIGQANNAVLTLGTLSGNAAGDVTLGENNIIGAIGTFAVTGANHSFSLTEKNNQSLAVSGPLTATQDVTLALSGSGTLTATGSIGAGGTLTATSGSGGIALNNGATLTAPSLVLSGNNGGIGLNGNAVLGQAAATVDLSTTGGGVTEAGTAIIIAGTLQSTSGVKGAVALTNGNSVAAIGDFAVTGNGNDFSLTNAAGQSMAVNGTLIAPNNVALATSGTGAITGSGKITATSGILKATSGSGGISLTNATLTAPTVMLNGAGGGIALNGTAGIATSGGTIDFATTAGGVTEAATASLNAGTLQSTGGITGVVSLVGSNTITSIADIAVASGGFTLLDTAALTVNGNLSATAGDVLLQTSNATGIKVGAAGQVNASASGLASFRAAKMSITAGGTVTGRTFEYSVNSAGVLTLGSGDLLSLAGVGTTNARIGQVAGTTTATSINISADFDAKNLPLQLVSSGVIDGSTRALLNVSTLSVTGGTVALTKSTNTISNLSDVSATSFSLNDSIDLNITGNVTPSGSATITVPGTLTVSGTVAAPTIKLTGSTAIAVTGSIGAGTTGSLTSGAGGIALNAGAILSGPTLVLNGANGGIALTGNALLGNGGIVDLTTTGGGVTEAATAFINAGTLRSAGGLVGTVNLLSSNTIASIGSINSAGDFILADGGLAAGATLTVAGPLTAPNVTLFGAPVVDVTGSIGATTSISLSGVAIDIANGTLAAPSTKLNAGSNGIAITGTAAIGQASAVVDINSAGTISEAATAVITAATLVSTSGISGNTSLLGTGNAIDNLGNIPLSAGVNFALLDGNGLTVIGTVGVSTGSGQVYLASSSGGVTIAATGVLQSGNSSGLVSVQSDSFTDSGSVAAATVELAPWTSGGTLTLGAAGGLSLPSLTGITTGNLILGAVTQPGGSRGTTAGAIAINGAFDTTGVSTVTLDATGAVTQTAALTGGSQLFGTAGSFTLTNGGNKFSAVGLTATAGDVLVVDSTGVTLGANSASGNIYVASPSETLTGVVTATGTLGLQTDSFTFVAGSLSGSTVELAPLTAGSTETLGAAGGLSLLSSGFITGNLRIGAVSVPGSGLTTTAGSIAVGGAFGSSGLVLELDTTGGIGQSGGAVLTAGTLTVNAAGVDLTAATNAISNLGSVKSTTFALTNGVDLTVQGNVAPTTSASITDTGTLLVNGTISSPAIALTADNIGIAGLVTDGGAGTTALIATSGTINETGTLIVGTLTGSSKGATKLAGATAATNQIATLGSFTAAGFTLNDGKALTVSGPLNGGASATITDAALLSITGLVSASAIGLQGTALAITGTVSDGGAGTVNLIATGGTIDESGTLIAGTLTGSASAAATLLGASATTNQIATLGNLVAAGFTLNDGNPLSVTGVVSGGTNVTVTDSGLLSVNAGGTVTAGAIGLTADNIGIAGLVTDGGSGTVNLIATTGTINETGTLVSGTLTGNSKAATNLAGASATTNQIATLGSFTAAGFTLNDGKALTVSGPLNGGASATITDAALLSITGLVSASAIGLQGTAIAIPGTVNDGGAGTVNLIATGGTIDENGTLIAGTLTGSASAAATLLGASATTNQIATLGNFSAAGFTLNDGSPLTVTGVVNGGTNVTVTDSGLLSVNAGGTVTATAIALTADNIGIAGLVSDGGAGTVALIATTGTINETGTLVSGTLTGNSKGATNLAGAIATTNQIATLGSFTAAGFALNDGKALTVSGPLNGGASATITDAALLSITGLVSASAIGLQGTAIAITGTVSDGGAGTVNLIATGGTIDETGTLIAGALTGSASAAATLLGATAITNQIATLGSFTAAGFTLNDGKALTVSGPLNGGASATIADAALLSITGLVSASAIGLQGTALAITGTVSDGGAGTVNLIATGGTIDESGTLIAGTLTGSATAAATLLGATTTTNQVATLGNFVAAGFTLNDGSPLTVTGVVDGGTNVKVTDSGLLNVNAGGTVTATAIALTADNIGIAGLVTAVAPGRSP